MTHPTKTVMKMLLADYLRVSDMSSDFGPQSVGSHPVGEPLDVIRQLWRNQAAQGRGDPMETA